jgi:mono/diheme cytochrome c family protein
MKMKFWMACLAACTTSAFAQDQQVTREQVQQGSKLYAHHCAPCHGPRMSDPEGAFDLRKFPPDQHDRFIRSVTGGKNSMPPWGGLLSKDEIESLWAYVTKGETTP